MRKLLFWFHLATGIVAGLIVVSMSLTGAMLAYEKQLLAWFDRGAWQSADTGGPRMPLEDLLKTAARPGATVIVRRDAREPVEINLGRDGSLYLDPRSGRELGKSSSSARRFFQRITAWHRYLGVEGPGRATAKLITGVCNLAFLCLVLSGAYLWIPRQWSWKHLRPVVWFRGGLEGKARDFNWHNTLGLWCAIPLAVVVAGAVPISFAWAGDLVYRVAGSAPPSAPSPAPARAAPSQVMLAGLDPLMARAAAQHPAWRGIAFRVPDSATAPVAFAIDWGTGGEPQNKGTLTVRRDAEGTALWETFEDGAPGRRLRTWLRFLHTGEALGLPGQTVAALASGCAVVLGYTGFALAWRRFRAWRTRSR